MPGEFPVNFVQSLWESYLTRVKEGSPELKNAYFSGVAAGFALIRTASAADANFGRQVFEAIEMELKAYHGDAAAGPIIHNPTTENIQTGE